MSPEYMVLSVSTVMLVSNGVFTISVVVVSDTSLYCSLSLMLAVMLACPITFAGNVAVKYPSSSVGVLSTVKLVPSLYVIVTSNVSPMTGSSSSANVSIPLNSISVPSSYSSSDSITRNKSCFTGRISTLALSSEYRNSSFPSKINSTSAFPSIPVVSNW